jgi:hypothetical protein
MTFFCCRLLPLIALIVAYKAASPSTTLTSWPSFQREVRGDLFISGSATADESGVASVELVVENKATNKYWNGASWQSRWIRYPINIAGAPTTTSWSDSIPASKLTQGGYFARAWTRAVNGNGDPVGDAQQTFSWSDRPQEVHDLAVTSRTETSISVSWRTDSDDRLKSFDFFSICQYYKFHVYRTCSWHILSVGCYRIGEPGYVYLYCPVLLSSKCCSNKHHGSCCDSDASTKTNTFPNEYPTADIKPYHCSTTYACSNKCSYASNSNVPSTNSR